MIYAEYIKCTRDILGDIETIEIRDIKTHEHRTVSPEQIVKAVQEGKIQIKYIKVSSDGKIHITKKNKITIADKIKSLEKEIADLRKRGSREDNELVIKKERLIDELDRKPHFAKYNPEDFKKF